MEGASRVQGCECGDDKGSYHPASRNYFYLVKLPLRDKSFDKDRTEDPLPATSKVQTRWVYHVRKQ